jgi:hypothetical protein
MATQQISILGANTIPDTGGLCYPYPYSQWASNDVWPVIVYAFGAFANNAQPSTRIGLYGAFTVPQNYVTSAVVIPIWCATLTSGDVVWDLDYRTVGGDDTTSLDQSGTEESVSVTDTSGSAANERLTPSLNPTDANFAAGETVEFGLFRDGTDAADTMAGTAFLFDLIFQYSDV